MLFSTGCVTGLLAGAHLALTFFVFTFHLHCHSYQSMFKFFISLSIIWSSANLVSRGLAMLHNRSAPAAPTTLITPSHRAHHQLDERQGINHITTCGYTDGNPQSSRTADPGYDCRIDTARGLWGFCPNSIFSARDCGLAGFCIDKHSCTMGCGRLFDRMDVTTFTWLATQPHETILDSITKRFQRTKPILFHCVVIQWAEPIIRIHRLWKRGED